MPELPEVETIKKDLENSLIGKKLLEVKIYQQSFFKKISKNNTVFKFTDLISQKVTEIKRKGKYLILLLETKAIFFHLGLTGALILSSSQDRVSSLNSKHLILRIDFEDLSLFFTDIRKFGKVGILEKDRIETFFSSLGKDALDISLEEFRDLLLSRNRLIKSFFLDQKIISGLGNIYTDEILFRTGISPLRKTKALSEREIERLYQTMQEVLVRAIKLKGSSVRNYLNGKGEKGAFQEEHLVYGRRGKPCPICGNPLQYRKISQRGTTFCVHCQNGSV